MGLLDYLFKIRPREAVGKAVEIGGVRAEMAVPVVAPRPPRDPAVFLQPKDFPPRSGDAVRAGAPSVEPVRAREIVLVLGDVLPRIPAALLKPEPPDLRRELRFAAEELSADIARGRAAVPVSKIAAQCPDIFHCAIAPADDVEIRLPLQKLFDQLIRPVLPARRTAPVSTPAAAPEAEPSVSLPVESAAVREDAECNVPDWDAGSGAESADEKIELSLAAIVAQCPDEIFVGERPRVDDSMRIAFPLAPIERQLAGGQVEITSQRFVAMLPLQLAGRFQARDGMKISLPLEEIFQNLPGRTVPGSSPQLPAPAPEPTVADEPLERPIEVRQPFRFFSPAPPVLHRAPLLPTVAVQEAAPPEPLVEVPVLVIPASASEPPPTPAPATPRPAGLPPLRSLELHASTDAPLATEPIFTVLHSITADPPPASAPPAAIMGVPCPPPARPLAILPPPIFGAAVSAQEPPESEPEIPLETTADQTAVLEFLSGADGVPAISRSRDD